MEKIISVCVILCSMYFVFSCSDDYESISPVPEEEGSRIELFIPGEKEVQVYSTATTSENRIENCFVVTFDNNGYKRKEKVTVSDIVKNGMEMALLPQLSFKIELGDTVYVICNTDTTETSLVRGYDINAKFKPAKAYYSGGEALPMSGSTIWSTSSSMITLTRAVAKVQVKLGENFSVEHFDVYPAFGNYSTFDESLCGFTVCNYADTSDIIPPLPPALSANISGLYNSFGLSPFYGIDDKCLRFTQYASTEDSMTIYVSEFPNSVRDCEGNPITNDEVFDKKRQFLLMIDRFTNGIPGDGMVTGFWRLDFYDAATKKYLDIKRNHSYIFTINKIRSAPYLCRTGTEGLQSIFSNEDSDAWHNAGSNIEYTINVENDWVNGVYSNGQYALFVSTDTINNTNIDIPFRLRAYAPSGVNIHLEDRLQKAISIVDRGGVPIGMAGDALELNINGSPYIPTDTWPYQSHVPVNGTTAVLEFTVNSSHSRFQYLDNAKMYIKLGNIDAIIPIRLN